MNKIHAANENGGHDQFFAVTNTMMVYKYVNIDNGLDRHFSVVRFEPFDGPYATTLTASAPHPGFTEQQKIAAEMIANRPSPPPKPTKPNFLKVVQ